MEEGKQEEISPIVDHDRVSLGELCKTYLGIPLQHQFEQGFCDWSKEVEDDNCQCLFPLHNFVETAN
jgi:hypothetical protein